MVIDWGLHYTVIVYICLKTVMNILTQLGIKTLRTLLRSIWICRVVLQKLQGICTLHLVGVTAPKTCREGVQRQKNSNHSC